MEKPLKAKAGFVLRDVGEGTVLVPTGERVLDMNGMVVLNETGRFIWERLDGTMTAAEIAEAITEKFEVGLEQAAADVREFMAELDSLGMLEASGASE